MKFKEICPFRIELLLFSKLNLQLDNLNIVWAIAILKYTMK